MAHFFKNGWKLLISFLMAYACTLAWSPGLHFYINQNDIFGTPYWWAFTFKIFHYWECGLETSYFKLTNVETPFTICFAVLYILVLLNIFFIFEQHKRSALIWKLQYFVTKKITWDLRGGGNNMLCCVVYTTFN